MHLRQLVRPFVPEVLVDLRNLYIRTRPVKERLCPICNYEGYFENFGKPPRLDARCPKCKSLERHRLFWLWFKGQHFRLQEPILHFAPEPVFEENFRRLCKDYTTADLFSKADLRLDIEDMELESSSVRTVICNHVLEHVDDAKALTEIRRIMTNDGVLICSVPIIEGWEQTYENREVETAFDRELHFGQNDHIRYYGRDFRDRLKDAGFTKVAEHTAEGQAVVKYGLLRGEKFFICSKS